MIFKLSKVTSRWSPSAWFEKCSSSLFCSHVCCYCHGGLLTKQGKSPPSIEKPPLQRLAFYFYNMCSLTPLGLEKSSREITRQINYFSQVRWLTFPVRYKLFGNREPINGTYSLLPSSTSGLLIYSISGVTCTNPPAVSSAGRSEGVRRQDGGSLNVELRQDEGGSEGLPAVKETCQRRVPVWAELHYSNEFWKLWQANFIAFGLVIDRIVS